MNVPKWVLGIIAAAFIAVATAYLFSLSKETRSTTAAGDGKGLRIFVSNYRSDTLSVVDDRLAREVKVIKTPEAPDGLAIRTRDPVLAVACGVASQVMVVDPVSLEVRGTVPVGQAPEDVAFGADGKLFVSSTSDDVLNVIDVDALKPDGEPIPFAKKPRQMVASPDGARIYVLLSGDEGEVAVVDAAKREVVGAIPLGGQLRGVDVTRDGRYLLVARFDDDTVSVVDSQTLLPIAVHEVGTGHGLVVHPTKPLAYSMASFDDEIHVFNFETGEVLKTMSFGEWPTYSAITKDGRYLYVAQEESDNVAKVDTETNELVVRVAVGTEPGHVAIFEMP